MSGPSRTAPMIFLFIALTLASCKPQQTYALENPGLKATSTGTTAPEPVRATSTLIPEPSATMPPACLDAEGRLLESSYAGVVYEHELAYLVYLPPCYADSALSYPTIFLLHGYPYDQTHWLDLGLVEAYERGVVNEGWPRVIFVLPYIPEPLFRRTDGGVGSYEQEFIEGLLPAINAQYRVLPGGDMRVLGGVSRGGVWALEIGLRNPEEIQHIIAISPALVYNQPRPRFDPFQIVGEDRTFPETLFLSAAINETPFREEIEAFVQVLEQQGIQHTFLLYPGNHNDETWHAIIDEILAQLMVGVTS